MNVTLVEKVRETVERIKKSRTERRDFLRQFHEDRQRRRTELRNVLREAGRQWQLRSSA